MNSLLPTIIRPQYIRSPDQSRGIRYQPCSEGFRWAVLPESPVWNDFLEIRDHVLRLLVEHPQLADGLDIQCTLVLVGPAQDRVWPAITVHCSDRRHRIKARKLLRATDEWKAFVKAHKEFGLMVAEEAPKPHGSTNLEEWLVRSTDGSLDNIGTAIDFIDRSSDAPNHALQASATTGPCLFIKSIDECVRKYCLTAHHPLCAADEEPVVVADWRDPENEDESEDEDDIVFDGVNAADTSSRLTAVDSMSIPGNEDGALLENYVQAYGRLEKISQLRSAGAGQSRENLEIAISRTSESDTLSMMSSEPVVVTQAATPNPESSIPPKVIGHVVQISAELDWALLENTSAHTSSKTIKCNSLTEVSGHPEVHVNSFGDMPTRSIPVLVLTSPTHPVKATLLPVISYYKSRYSKTFIQVVTIRTSTHLVHGHCGAAVVDTQTGAWHGQIIAGYPDSDISFMVPSNDIREDIARRMKVDIKTITLSDPDEAGHLLFDRPQSAASNLMSDLSTKKLIDLDVDKTLNQLPHTPKLTSKLYSRLSENEFRLIELLPEHKSLTCRLTVAKLPQWMGSKSMRTSEDSSDRRGLEKPHPDYFALSYVWGEASSIQTSHRLTLLSASGMEKIEVPVTDNLWSFLQSWMRRTRILGRRKEDPRFWWIDALCINQPDIQERNHQVCLMSAIYNSASTVMVWLGHEDASTKPAVSMIEKLNQQNQSWSLSAEEGYALADLCTRPWFSRVWVVQELAFSRNTELFLGEKLISWQEFSNAIILSIGFENAIQQKVRPPEDRAQFLSWPLQIKRSLASQLIKTSHLATEKHTDGTVLARRMTLASLMTELHQFQSTNIYDTVYALLSLASDARATPFHAVDRCRCAEPKWEDRVFRPGGTYLRSESPSDEHLEIKVDYSTPLEELSRRMVKKLIKQSFTLDILFDATVINQEAGAPASMPTWWPNINLSPMRKHKGLLYRIRGDSFTSDYTCRTLQRMLSRGRKPEFSLCDNGDNLRVRGYAIGQVHEVTDVALDSIISQDWLRLAESFQYRTSARTRLSSILIAGKGDESFGPQWHWQRKAFEWGIAQFPRDANIDVPSLLRQLQQYREFHMTSTLLNATTLGCQKYWELVWATCFNRRLFTISIGTSDDMLLVLGPRQVKITDTVCIFWGCTVPVVLREGKDGWKVVGESFIDPLAFDEILKHAGRYDLREREFRLI